MANSLLTSKVRQNATAVHQPNISGLDSLGLELLTWAVQRPELQAGAEAILDAQDATFRSRCLGAAAHRRIAGDPQWLSEAACRWPRELLGLAPWITPAGKELRWAGLGPGLRGWSAWVQAARQAEAAGL